MCLRKRSCHAQARGAHFPQALSNGWRYLPRMLSSRLTMTSRRHFLSASTAAFAASSFHIFGADPAKKYRTALIGSGWWGMNILKEALVSGRVKVCALCDVHEDVVSNAGDTVNGISGDDAKRLQTLLGMRPPTSASGLSLVSSNSWR